VQFFTPSSAMVCRRGISGQPLAQDKRAAAESTAASMTGGDG